MPPLIPDAPWWFNALLILVVVAATNGVTVWVAQIRNREAIDEIRANVANDHASNLRDDLDGVVRTQERHSRFLRDLNKSIEGLGHSIHRRDELQTAALNEAVDDRARELRSLRREICKHIDQHTTACPARAAFTETKEADDA